jgi:hypothetical protein
MPGRDMTERDPLCKRQEGPVSNLEEIPLLGRETREGLNRLPVRPDPVIQTWSML